MDGKQIDRLARFLARGASRRGAVKTMAAGALGGAALAQASPRGAAAQDALGEEWVQLYEELAAAVDTITGECGMVTDAMQQFQAENADRIAQMQADIAGWTPEQVAAHQEAYGARVQQAAIALHLAMTRCGYVEGSDSPHSLADSQAEFGPPAPAPGATPVASPVANRKAAPAALPASQISESCSNGPGYCDCACNNDFTVGNCILFGLACAFGGCASPPNCCWSGICVAGFDHTHCVQQCENCVNVQVSGSNCG